MKRKTLIGFLTGMMFYCIPLISHAQGPNPGDDPDVPIDGGISLLVAAGISYVAKKGYEKSKKAGLENPDK